MTWYPNSRYLASPGAGPIYPIPYIDSGGQRYYAPVVDVANDSRYMFYVFGERTSTPYIGYGGSVKGYDLYTFKTGGATAMSHSINPVWSNIPPTVGMEACSLARAWGDLLAITANGNTSTPSTPGQIVLWDIVTNTQTANFVGLPEIGSNLLFANNLLWFTTKTKYDAALEQRLVSVNSSGTIISQVNIPVQSQVTRRHLAYDGNGHILLTNINNLSISKFNTSDGSLVNTYRIHDTAHGSNKDPIRIQVIDKNNIYIFCKDNYMITKYDSDTNIFTHKSYAVGNVSSTGYHNGKLWWCSIGANANGTDNTRICDLRLSNNDLQLTDGIYQDFSLTKDNFTKDEVKVSSAFTVFNFYMIHTTPSVFDAGTSTTIAPLLWIFTAGNVYAWDISGLYRKASYKIECRAMIGSTDIHQVIGDGQ